MNDAFYHDDDRLITIKLTRWVKQEASLSILPGPGSKIDKAVEIALDSELTEWKNTDLVRDEYWEVKGGR